MKHSQYLDAVGNSAHNNFTNTRNSTQPIQIRVLGKRGSYGLNCFIQIAGRYKIATDDVFKNLPELSARISAIT